MRILLDTHMLINWCSAPDRLSSPQKHAVLHITEQNPAIVAGISLWEIAMLVMLRRVELERPPTAIGRNTIHAVQSGLVLGYAEMVKGMVIRFDEELGGGSKVVATGGLARLMDKETGIFDAVNPDLTLTGLRIIYELNS